MRGEVVNFDKGVSLRTKTGSSSSFHGGIVLWLYCTALGTPIFRFFSTQRKRIPAGLGSECLISYKVMKDGWRIARRAG
jgi:hypothetical protein